MYDFNFEKYGIIIVIMLRKLIQQKYLPLNVNKITVQLIKLWSKININR